MRQAEDGTISAVALSRDGDLSKCPRCGGVVIEAQSRCEGCEANLCWPKKPPPAGIDWKSAGVMLGIIWVASTFSNSRLLLIAIGLEAGASLPFLIAAACLGSFFGANVEAIKVFTGSNTLVVRWKGVRLMIGSFPISTGFVRWSGGDRDESHFVLPAGRRCLWQLNPWQRLAVSTTGPAWYIGLATYLLGVTSAWATVTSTYWQGWTLVSAPLTAGPELLAPFFQALAAGDWLRCVGVMSAKSAAASLIFSGSSLGGVALFDLWEGLTGRRASNYIRGLFTAGSLLIMLPVYLLFCIALLKTLLTRRF